MTHPDLAGYPVVEEVPVAWGDMDAFGHVNNVAYFRYCENARIAYLDRIGWMRSAAEAGLGPIIATASLRYRKPVRHPDRLLVGVRAASVEADRVTFEYRLVSTATGVLVAEGQGVVVSYDYRAGGKCPIPDAIRGAIEAVEGQK